MLLGFTIPDVVLTSLIGPIFGSLIAAFIVAYATQIFIEKRELRNRREASGLIAAYLQWHLERGLRSLPLVERM